ncbi:FAD-dependent monooxygenase [Ruania zhangjianzhongii]|uniref:FAD-dependent monooxygenase n=1 Tax=Ruania zhangjianzhongii TaxID=2603206 RepID=UPI00143CFE72|nr:FAD-dependent monooxygenase [Ruania zhangjianzhongii]
MTTIHIVGGGIAGLTLALTLQRPEWDVIVHEHRRRPEEREVGTAFGLWPPAMTALDQIGIGAAVRDRGVHAATATIRTADDRALIHLPRQDVVMIARTTLHHLLRTALPARAHQRAGRVSDSRLLTGEVIVGADGARSVVRRDHWGRRAAARSPGTTVIRGVIESDLAHGEVTEYWGNGQLFGITPVSAHHTNWFTAFPEQRFESTEHGLRHLRHTSGHFPAQVQDTLAAARPDQTLINGIHISRTLPALVRGRTVLIGDAAHAMTPNAGRGACESILDAVALGTLLNHYPPAEALRRYRWRRLVSPQLIRATSSILMNVALASGRSARTRNSLVRTLTRG